MPGNTSYWGRELTGHDVYEEALVRMRHIYDTHDTVVVSFSGGKDSTVALHVAIDVATELGRLPVKVIHFDEEAIPYETEHYVREVAAWPEVDLEHWCLPCRHRNACSPQQHWWWPWAPEDEAKWVRPLPPEALTQDDLPAYPRRPADRMSIPELFPLIVPWDRYGRVACIQGLRVEESLARLRAMVVKLEDNYISARPDNGKSGAMVDGCYPIYDMTDIDVWTVIKLREWPYNSGYDIMEMAGVPYRQSKCCPPYGEEPVAGLWVFKVAFPDIWDRMIDRVPGAGTAARYARTSLYSYGGILKPDDVAWPQFVRDQIMKWPDDNGARAAVALKVQEWIQKHYRDTVDPIAATAPHPLTGVSWHWLAQTVQRGDFKDRRQPPIFGFGYRDRPQARYDTEMETLKEEGRLWEIGL